MFGMLRITFLSFGLLNLVSALQQIPEDGMYGDVNRQNDVLDWKRGYEQALFKKLKQENLDMSVDDLIHALFEIYKIERTYNKRNLDSIGGGNLVRSLDSIGGGNLVRSLDSIGGGNLVRSLDSIGGGNLVRSLDSIGGGNLVRRSTETGLKKLMKYQYQ